VLAEPRQPEPTRRRELEAWRDASIQAARQLILAPASVEVSPHDTASLLSGLADTRVRDTLLWELVAADAEQLPGALAVLMDGLRAAPDGLVAPVATATAVVAWLLGDGARAGIAVERALTDRPDYTLAQLVAQSLHGGLPPAAWRAAMGSVTREECRHGMSGADTPR
jgi:hypothetical protein